MTIAQTKIEQRGDFFHPVLGSIFLSDQGARDILVTNAFYDQLLRLTDAKHFQIEENIEEFDRARSRKISCSVRLEDKAIPISLNLIENLPRPEYPYSSQTRPKYDSYITIDDIKVLISLDDDILIHEVPHWKNVRVTEMVAICKLLQEAQEELRDASDDYLIKQFGFYKHHNPH